jgi:hypothetical protein
MRGENSEIRVCSGTVSGQHGVSTGSASNRVSVAISGTSHNDPVATAPGTDLILKLGEYHLFRNLDEHAFRYNKRTGNDLDRFIEAAKSVYREETDF